jgi:hypothetical protein
MQFQFLALRLRSLLQRRNLRGTIVTDTLQGCYWVGGNGFLEKMAMKKLLIVLLAWGCVSGQVYAKNDKMHGKASALPPGLQKNYQRGKPLPPGWQKKLSVGDTLDRQTYANARVVLPLGKDGAIAIEVGDSIYRVHEKTRRILDILRP